MYSQPGYPQPGYPQPGYPQPGYPGQPMVCSCYNSLLSQCLVMRCNPSFFSFPTFSNHYGAIRWPPAWLPLLAMLLATALLQVLATVQFISPHSVVPYLLTCFFCLVLALFPLVCRLCSSHDGPWNGPWNDARYAPSNVCRCPLHSH
jgi:hypothetical protein